MIRNPVYNAFGSIDCEYSHHRFGWIPFTASADDPEPLGRDLYASAAAGEFGPVAAYVPPVRTVADAQSEKLAALAAMRYARETAGLVINGATVKTDRESQAALTGAYTSLKNGLVSAIDWKADGRVWVSLSLAQVEAMAQAVAAHVQACFTAERAHAESISALTTVEAVDAYDVSTGWPA